MTRPTGLPDGLSFGCDDHSTLEQLEADGAVPWQLFAREQRWREELQRTLDEILTRRREDPRIWMESAEAVQEGRRKIMQMSRRLSELERNLDATRAELDRLEKRRDRAIVLAEQAERDATSPRPPPPQLAYRGQSLDEFLHECRGYALREARARSEVASEAYQMLGLCRSVYYRHLQTHGIT